MFLKLSFNLIILLQENSNRKNKIPLVFILKTIVASKWLP